MRTRFGIRGKTRKRKCPEKKRSKREEMNKKIVLPG